MPRYMLLPYFSAERFPGQKISFTWPAWRSNYDPGIALYYYKVPGREPVLGVYGGKGLPLPYILHCQPACSKLLPYRSKISYTPYSIYLRGTIACNGTAGYEDPLFMFPVCFGRYFRFQGQGFRV